MDETKRNYNYTLIVNSGSMVFNQFLNTDVNLLEMYKAALVSGSGVIT
jgi:hypothetical protein